MPGHPFYKLIFLFNMDFNNLVSAFKTLRVIRVLSVQIAVCGTNCLHFTRKTCCNVFPQIFSHAHAFRSSLNIWPQRFCLVIIWSFKRNKWLFQIDKPFPVGYHFVWCVHFNNIKLSNLIWFSPNQGWGLCSKNYVNKDFFRTSLHPIRYFSN